MVSIVSKEMKRLEQTVCNYHRRLDGTGQNPDVVQMSINKAFAYLLSESHLLILAYEKQWYWEGFSCNSCSVVWTLIHFNLQKMKSRMFKKKFKAEHYKAEAGPRGLTPKHF